ncbi:alpha/beta hydrolase [Nocardioides sp. KR10-350]|uniref:alpha/beta hydrolase n=1 Tax=Nocardioides cheoyonin TaxID=3156615 RepID=UPI0032B60183
MDLFPDARRAVEADAAGPRVWDLDIAAERAAARRAAAAEPREEVAEVAGVDAAWEGRRVPCRLYTPADVREGVVVHLHGGGFVFNDIEVHDAACRRLANRTRLRVLSVDYRRPPEHRFPAAPDDVDTVLRWMDADPLLGALPAYVHGDSAGGNLALVAALRNPGRFRAAALIYPFLDPTASAPSYAVEGGWAEEARWYWQQYAAGPEDLTNPDLAPLLSDGLAGLPPTLVVSAEGDILVDEDEAFAHRLAGLGVEVVAFRAVGQVHGFWRHGLTFPAAGSVMAMTAAFFAEHP